MSPRRIHAAGVVLGLSVATALWLLTYRVWQVIPHNIGPDGTAIPHYAGLPPEHVRLQPWWSVPAAVLVLIAGIDASLRLWPGNRGLLRRLTQHLSGASPHEVPRPTRSGS